MVARRKEKKGLIVDYKSQYTRLIGRTTRELKVRFDIVQPENVAVWLQNYTPSAIILSGGYASVNDKDAPGLPPELLPFIKTTPTLGVCYGMQLITRDFGGVVESQLDHRQYGSATVTVNVQCPLFAGLHVEQEVWASHGDTVTKVPDGYRVTARSKGSIAAVQNGNIFGVQFHPEVTHTPEGKQMLANFLFGVAKCEQDLAPTSLITDLRANAMAHIGPTAKVICGGSGGVDSTVAIALLALLLGERLLVILIDAGHLREGEVEQARANVKAAGAELVVIDAREEFRLLMSGVTDAAQVRERFTQGYQACFAQAARDFSATILLQGTLAPDEIETARIKKHHNVGWKLEGVESLHPLSDLYKNEVRQLARDLGLPASVSERQPFPGPSLFLRVVGVEITPELLDIVRWADARVQAILVRRGLYAGISQLVVALLGVKLVGVKGDERDYQYPIMVRAVRTVDFMTAKGVHFDEDTQNEIEQELTRHSQIGQVLFNSMDKPPATTEPI